MQNQEQHSTKQRAEQSRAKVQHKTLQQQKRKRGHQSADDSTAFLTDHLNRTSQTAEQQASTATPTNMLDFTRATNAIGNANICHMIVQPKRIW
eukprot:1902319-Rhodomonas_salina.1